MDTRSGDAVHQPEGTLEVIPGPEALPRPTEASVESPANPNNNSPPIFVTRLELSQESNSSDTVGESEMHSERPKIDTRSQIRIMQVSNRDT